MHEDKAKIKITTTTTTTKNKTKDLHESIKNTISRWCYFNRFF